jgi:hypothetical protein
MQHFAGDTSWKAVTWKTKEMGVLHLDLRGTGCEDGRREVH